MRDEDVEYLNTYRRVRDFGIENAADFPKNLPGDKNFKVFIDEIPKVEAAEEIQISGIGKSATISKETAAANVLEDMRGMNRTARGFGVDFPDIGALFRMIHDNGYESILTGGMAYYTNSEPHEQLFLDYGRPVGFRTRLQTNLTALQAAITKQDKAKNSKTGATGAAAASMRLMNQALQRLRGIVPSVYEDNPEKLAAWQSASHVKRPAKKAAKDNDKTEQ